MTEEQVQQTNQEDLWRINNYILLKDYLDRTISRIAARCVRTGNIAIEDYPFYGYVLDILDEICETGDYILSKPHLNDTVEQKIEGGLAALKKGIEEFKLELQNNSSPDMIKADDNDDLAKAKAIFGDPGFDPTQGAGMSIDDVVAKLAEEHNKEIDEENALEEDEEQEIFAENILTDAKQEDIIEDSIEEEHQLTLKEEALDDKEDSI